jgi:hypothetical protein
MAGRYRALIAQLDADIGKILETLQKTGQAKNTMVIVASDNGGANKARDDNYPFYGKKAEYLEGGERTPLIIHWPGGQGAGRRSNAVVTLRDVAVTVAAVAGASTKGMQGHDLWAIATGRSRGWTRPLFWESNYSIYGNLFSVLSPSGRWRLVAGPGNLQLYDLKSDPSGAYDVADAHPDVVRHLLALYHAWHKRIRRLHTHYKRLARGAVVTKDDLLRTPGRGGFSFGIGVRTKNNVAGPQVIAEQPHVWKLIRNGQNFTLDLGTGKLHGHLPASAAHGQCAAVVWTGYFHRAVGLPKDHDHAYAALYVNGVSAAARHLPLPIVGHFLHEPTWIGRNANGEMLFKGRLSKPRMIKDYLHAKANNRAPGAKTFSKTLCPSKQ